MASGGEDGGGTSGLRTAWRLSDGLSSDPWEKPGINQQQIGVEHLVLTNEKRNAHWNSSRKNYILPGKFGGRSLSVRVEPHSFQQEIHHQRQLESNTSELRIFYSMKGGVRFMLHLMKCGVILYIK